MNDSDKYTEMHIGTVSQTTGQENRGNLKGHWWSTGPPRCKLTEPLQAPSCTTASKLHQMCLICPVICFYMTHELRIILIFSVTEKVNDSISWYWKFYEFQMWATVHKTWLELHLAPLFMSVAASLSWRPGVYKANTAIIWPSTKEACQHLVYDHCLLIWKPTQYMIKWKGQVSK